MFFVEGFGFHQLFELAVSLCPHGYFNDIPVFDQFVMDALQDRFFAFILLEAEQIQ